MLHENNSDDFDELKFHQLNRFTKLLVERHLHVPIDRIVLYRYYYTENEEFVQRRHSTRRKILYVVAYEIPGLDLELYREHLPSVDSTKHIFKTMKFGSIRHILKIWYSDVPEEIAWANFMDKAPQLPLWGFMRKTDNLDPPFHKKSPFIYPGFELVHRGILPTDLLKMKDEERECFLRLLFEKWIFIAVPSGEPLPEKEKIYVDNTFSCVLWEAKTQEKRKIEQVYNETNLNGLPQDVIDHVRLVKPSVIEIYNSLKEGPGWNQFDDSDGKQARMEDALNFYDMNQTAIGKLNRNTLEDPDLYKKGLGKEKRDIVGRILQKDIMLHGHGKHNARKLYKIFQTIK